MNEQFVPTFGEFLTEKEEIVFEGAFKKGDSFITKKEVTLTPTSTFFKDDKASGTKSKGEKKIAKGKKVEIYAVMKSKEGSIMVKTSEGYFDEEDLIKAAK